MKKRSKSTAHFDHRPKAELCLALHLSNWTSTSQETYRQSCCRHSQEDGNVVGWDGEPFMATCKVRKFEPDDSHAVVSMKRALYGNSLWQLH